MSIEESRGGSRIYRHDNPAPAELAEGDQGLIDAVSDHVRKHFGEPESVLHEIISTYVHVDLHVVMPTEERPVITVVTSGMSERPMPGDVYAELMLVLPPTWPTQGDPAFETEEGYWPYRLLKTLARLPHEFQTRLWLGDTVPNGDPPERYARNTKLCGALIAPDGDAAARGRRALRVRRPRDPSVLGLAAARGRDADQARRGPRPPERPA